MIRNPYRAYHVIIEKGGQEAGRVHFQTKGEARAARDTRRENFPVEKVTYRYCGDRCNK